MEIKTILNTSLYGIPIIIGGCFFEKEPLLMGFLIIFSCALLAIKLYSDIETEKILRSTFGYGDLK